MAEQGFEWLTEAICKEYAARAAKLPPGSGEDTGAWRSLREELRARCNLTEVEAVNILRGYNVREYVMKYGILSGAIPRPQAMIEAEERKKKRTKSDAEKIREYEEKIAVMESLAKSSLSSFGFEEKD